MSCLRALPPHGILTPDDHGAFVDFAAYILIVITILFVIIRLILRIQRNQVWKLDDYFLALATVRLHHFLLTYKDTGNENEQYFCWSQLTLGFHQIFAIIETILVALAVKNGLGKRRNDLSDKQFEIYSKARLTMSL